METMADAYAGLGVHEAANEVYAALASEVTDGPPARVARLYGRLATGTSQLGRHEEAEAWAVKAVAAAESIRPADTGALALALDSRCLALSRAARHGEARPLCEAAAAQARLSDLSRVEQVRVLRDYGDALKNTGAFDDAEEVLLEALDRSRGDTAAPQPATATTLNALGSLYFRQGRFDEATAAYRDAIVAQRALYPTGARA